MPRNKNKRKNAKKPLGTPISIVFPDNISADEMKHIIAGGLLEFEQQKKQREDEAKELSCKEWQHAIGVKDFSSVKRPKKWLLQSFNFLQVFWNICTVPQKHIKGDGVIFSLMQMILAMLFGAVNVILLILAFLIVLCPLGSFLGVIPAMRWENIAVIWSCGLLAFVLSRIFRIASFEIIKMEDHNYLFGLFACVTSIISVVIAVITLVITRK